MLVSPRRSIAACSTAARSFSPAARHASCVRVRVKVRVGFRVRVRVS